jgi:hypothetical protein
MALPERHALHPAYTLAAIDGKHRAGHISASVRGEQQEWTIEISRYAEAPLGNAF